MTKYFCDKCKVEVSRSRDIADKYEHVGTEVTDSVFGTWVLCKPCYHLWKQYVTAFFNKA